MLLSIAAIQILLLAFFFFLERFSPARSQSKPKQFYLWLFGIGVFGLAWLRLVFFMWISIDVESLLLIGHWPAVEQGIFLYLFYSMGNYWFHRWKHSNSWLWRNLHLLHHSPTHMETVVAFFRHPLEMMINTLYLLLIGKLIFGASVEAVAIALAIEGCLETFHHSNISTPKKWRWVGYIIQLPEMHLVHHEYGLHKYNYGPFLWDTVFGTVKIPFSWNKKLGFKFSDDLSDIFFLSIK